MCSSSVPPAPDDLAAVVARLRAAGCVFAEDEADLLASAAATPQELAALVGRRVAGLPLEHVLGWAEFCGLRIAVGPGVFVPRPRTGFLVRLAAAGLARARAHPPVVLDLCCGSGAVGIAVAAATGPVRLHAADVDPAAVEYARRNLATLAPGGVAHLGDLYAPLPDTLRGRVDALVVNAPYVPTDEIRLLPPEARTHEPRVALDGGADGIAVQRRVAATATQWLAPGGRLLVETGVHQATATARAFTDGGLRARVVRSPAYGATVVVGTAR